MFNKKFKLLTTMVGLVAMLVGLMAMPGVTQVIQPILTRKQIIQGLNQLVSATLTASEGDILDVENAEFISRQYFTYSDNRTPPRASPMANAHIPLHPSSRSVQLLYNWLDKDEPFGDYLNLGALYVGDDFPGCPGYDRLTTGIYHLKVRKDLKLIAVDPEGREFVIGYVKKEKYPQASSNTILSSAESCPICVIGGLVALVIGAVSNPQFCITTSKCMPVMKPNGETEIVCWKEQECYGC